MIHYDDNPLVVSAKGTVPLHPLLSDVEQAVEACKTQNLEHFAVYVGKYQAPPAGGALLLKL